MSLSDYFQTTEGGDVVFSVESSKSNSGVVLFVRSATMLVH